MSVFALSLSLGLSLTFPTGCDQDQDGDGWTVEQGDCDDAAPQVYPGAPELCNGMDDDCDALVDADDPSLTPTTWYRDKDGDGQGGSNSPIQGCPAPDGYVAASGDCDDADPAVYPGALEVCDDQDNDCDQLADEEDPELSGNFVYYPDADEDGFGSTDGAAVETCEPGAPADYHSSSGDCDDSDPTVHPEAFDYPNDGVDNDCDGHAVAWLQIAGGGEHTLALDDQGRAWAWGYNGVGQLGDGTYTTRKTPVQVVGLCDTMALSAGSDHSLALCRDGTVQSWGYNYYGQLGIRTGQSNSPIPVEVPGLTAVQAVAAGSEHSLALLKDGTVMVWGHRLACGTYEDCHTPILVTGLERVIAVRGGGYHSLALLEDGTAKAWGDNNYGQLGDGTTTWRSAPVSVSGLADAKQLSAGIRHSLARRGESTVLAWGYNAQGQLGDGTLSTRTLPVAVVGLKNAVSIEAGGSHSLALLSDDNVRTWGWNRDGQLGDGTTTDRTTPVEVSRLNRVMLLGAGAIHSLAIESAAAAWAWGNNRSGQLGDGTLTSRSLPVLVVPPGP